MIGPTNISVVAKPVLLGSGSASSPIFLADNLKPSSTKSEFGPPTSPNFDFSSANTSAAADDANKENRLPISNYLKKALITGKAGGHQLNDTADTDTDMTCLSLESAYDPEEPETGLATSKGLSDAHTVWL